MRWFPVCCVTAVLAAPALAQVSDGQRLQEQLRRNRLETIDRVEASRKEAWEAFVASARKEGVFLDCRIASPARGRSRSTAGTCSSRATATRSRRRGATA